ARNYLLAVVELKKRRGFTDWRKTLRAALSFDLWGDPEAPPPVPVRAPKKPPVTAKLQGNRLAVRIPRSALPLSEAGAYQASVRPGGALAGLYNFIEDEAGEVVGRRLSELVFVDVGLRESFVSRTATEKKSERPRPTHRECSRLNSRPARIAYGGFRVK